ncbi:MAG: hypothetical protein DI588_14355 [Flavobacterium johnsoniae]|nr:MAG: hypothetical protein DI588_14355 [Flavobacterium johnsoniae]
MKKSQNANSFSSVVAENKATFQYFLKGSFGVKSIHNFDIFQYSNMYQEKLPIIYANIRV